jgi:hypothetical protein
LAFTGRYFSGQEALEKGFVSYVCQTKEAALKKALEIAGVIASKSPVAVYGTKALLDYSRDHTIREGLEYTQLWNSIYLQTSVCPDKAYLIIGYQRSFFILLRKTQAEILKAIETLYSSQHSAFRD